VSSVVCWCYMLSWLPIAALDPVYSGCYGDNQTYCFTSPRLNSYDSGGNELLMSISNARTWCRQRGLSLTSVDSEAKHRALLEFLFDYEYSSDDVWIDGGLQPGNITWTWINGAPYYGKARERYKDDEDVDRICNSP